MALQQAVGTTAGVSVTLPATHDAAGFGALTYPAIGKISTVPNLTGTYDIATFDNLGTGEEEKFADILRAGSGEFMVGYDPSDAGQTILEANQGSKAAFAFTLRDGTIYYRIATITSYGPSNITVGGVVMASVNLEFEKAHVKV